MNAWSKPLAEEPVAAAGARPPRVNLMGIAIDSITEAGLVSAIVSELSAGRGGWVVTPNLDHLRRLSGGRDFRDLCANAQWVVADGMPLIWASRLQGTPLPERVAGSNLIFSLNQALARQGRRVFFLGGDPGTARAAADKLQAQYPGLEVVGCECPEVGFERDPARMQQLRSALQQARPELVWVALGSPKQERLIEHLRHEFPATWWLGVGISFSFVCGQVQRAPRWMQSLGLEWLHRLVQEPRRLARRYLLEGLPFAVRLFSSALGARLRGKARV